MEIIELSVLGNGFGIQDSLTGEILQQEQDRAKLVPLLKKLKVSRAATAKTLLAKDFSEVLPNVN